MTIVFIVFLSFSLHQYNHAVDANPVAGDFCINAANFALVVELGVALIAL